MAILTGHTELITELEQYAKALDRDALEEIVASGGSLMVEGIKDQVIPAAPARWQNLFRPSLSGSLALGMR